MSSIGDGEDGYGYGMRSWFVDYVVEKWLWHDGGRICGLCYWIMAGCDVQMGASGDMLEVKALGSQACPALSIWRGQWWWGVPWVLWMSTLEVLWYIGGTFVPWDWLVKEGIPHPVHLEGSVMIKNTLWYLGVPCDTLEYLGRVSWRHIGTFRNLGISLKGTLEVLWTWGGLVKA